MKTLKDFPRGLTPVTAGKDIFELLSMVVERIIFFFFGLGNLRMRDEI